jgi:hypothetical protein
MMRVEEDKKEEDQAGETPQKRPAAGSVYVSAPYHDDRNPENFSREDFSHENFFGAHSARRNDELQALLSSLGQEKPKEGDERPGGSLSPESPRIGDGLTLQLRVLSALSHDLKTPLASIIGSLEIHQKIKDHLSPEKKEMLIDAALAEAHRLDGLISAIVELAKIEAGMIVVHRQPCDLSSLISAAIAVRRRPALEATIAFRRPDRTLWLVTDESLLLRAIDCLISHALRVAGGKPSLQVTYRLAGNRAEITISVPQATLTPGQMRENFDEYPWMIEQDNRQREMWLGLHIAKKITLLLGGALTCDIAADGQALYGISLPLEGANKEGTPFSVD